MRKKISDCRNFIEKIENNPIVYRVRSMLKVNRENQVSAFAAQAAFFLLLSFFPLIMVILYGVRFFFDTEEQLVGVAEEFVPQTMVEYLDYMIGEAYQIPLGITMIFSIIVAVWSAARGTMAIERGLNFMDRTEDTKNYIVRRLINACYTLIFCVMLIALIGVYVFGNTIMNIALSNVAAGLTDVIEKIYIFLRLLTGPVLIFSMILLIYCRLPDNHLKLKTVIPGAIFTTVCFVLLSVAFSTYFEYFGFNTYMYGNLGGMIIAMIWIYACMYVFMVGAEINLFFRDEVTKAWKKFIGRIRKSTDKDEAEIDLERRKTNE